MSWKVVETDHWSEKAFSEDYIAIGRRSVGVFDGHSSGNKKMVSERSGGWLAAVTAGGTLVEGGHADSPQGFVDLLSQQVRCALVQKGYFDEPPGAKVEHYRPGCVGVIFIPEWNKIIRVGDCNYYIDGMGNNPGLEVDRFKAKMRSALLRRYRDLREWTPALLQQSDPTQTVMRDLHLNWQRHYRNNAEQEWGYGVLDGTHVPERFVEVIDVPRGAREIVLTSDGIHRLAVRPTAAETKAALEALFDEDPLCLGRVLATHGRKPGKKFTDDCSYVRLVWE